MIAKRKDSKYQIGKRSRDWKKIKALKTVDCVIAGVTVGEGNRAETFGALILALYDDAGELRCVGRVGTGFDANMVELLHRRLAALDSPMPFRERPNLAGEVKFWCRPELVAEVEYLMFTPDIALRGPFSGQFATNCGGFSEKAYVARPNQNDVGWGRPLRSPARIAFKTYFSRASMRPPSWTALSESCIGCSKVAQAP